MPRSYRLVLIEDHPVTLEGLRTLLDREPDLDVVGTAASAPAALDLLARETPDLALIDVRIADGDGIELTKNVKALYPDLAVLILSARDESVYAERAVRAGAAGFVMKTETTAVILAAVRNALDGRLYLSESMRERLLGHYLAAGGNDAQSASPVALLTDRELETFGHFGRGLSTAEVAHAMMVSPKTVETHRVHIKRKLSITTTNDLVRQATLWVNASGS